MVVVDRSSVLIHSTIGPAVFSVYKHDSLLLLLGNCTPYTCINVVPLLISVRCAQLLGSPRFLINIRYVYEDISSRTVCHMVAHIHPYVHEVS